MNTTTKTSLDTLVRYVPLQVLRDLADRPSPTIQCAFEQFPATVLFADISGFTIITAAMSARGGLGAEQISRLLNSCFGQIIDQVLEHGGDIANFAGDGLIAFWRVQESAPATSARLAAQCGLAIQEKLASFTYEQESIRLSMRINLCTGPLTMMYLGGVMDRWDTLFSGPMFDRILALKPVTQPESVVACENSWAHLDGVISGEPVGRGGVRMQRVMERLAPAPASPPALSPAVEPALRSMIPSPVLSRLDAGQSEWLAELRRISVLFVGLPAVDKEVSAVALERMQAAMRAVQQAVYRQQGNISKTAVDEKGAVVVAAFGLPPRSHENDPARAVKAALMAKEELGRLGLHGSVGVSTGRLFCGVVGNGRRSEHGMMGSPMNLAARLMGMAEGSVLCDEATFKSARKELVFEEPPEQVQLKGFAEKVPVFRPTGEAKPIVQPKVALVGRSKEREALVQRIQELMRTRSSAVLILEGDAGIGKSRLVDEMLREARDNGLQALVGAADAVEYQTPYFAWRPIVSQLFGLQSATSDLATHVRAQLGDDEELLRLAPLLNALFPLDLADNEFTAQMTGEARANRTHGLLARLLARAAAASPLLLVIEDGHWLDSPSWALLKTIVRDLRNTLVVLATRPMRDTVPAEYTDILALPTLQKLSLASLSAEESSALICQRLGVLRLPGAMAQILHERSGGNPLFVEELAYMLRDTGQIAVDGEECRMVLPPEEFAKVRLPDSIEGVVTSRLDRLSSGQQLVLKVASVIGRSFPLGVLQDVYPLEADRPAVPDLLQSLVALEIVRPEGTAASQTFIFRHVLMQEAVYGVMLFSQRRDLHRAIAEWYERKWETGERSGRQDAAKGSKPFELLAHHWEAAEVWPNAVRYLEKAGEQALATFANEETVRFYNRAIALGRTHGIKVELERTAIWERNLAEACHRLGNFPASRQHGQVALAALGHPLPRSSPAFAAGLLGQIVLLGLRRLFPGLFAIRDVAERRLRLAATRVQNQLTEIFAFEQDVLRTLYSGMRELNIAEPAGPSAELSRGYALLTAVLGLVPLHRVCRAWSRRALKAAEASEQPAALSYALTRVALYDLYLAHWDIGTDRANRAMEIGRLLGHRRLREEAVATLGKLSFYSGRLQDSRRFWEELATSSLASDDEQIQAWSQFGRAENLIRLGDAPAALGLLEKSIGWVASKASASEELWMYGLMALARLRTGDPDRALSVADRMLPLIRARPTGYWTQQSLAAVAEVYLALWESGQTDVSAKSEQAVRGCERFAKIFPFGRAQALLWRGVYERLAGRPAKARASLDKCIEASEEITTPYERGRAYLELGCMLPATDPSRRHHLKRARTLLEPLAAQWELRQIRNHLGDE